MISFDSPSLLIAVKYLIYYTLVLRQCAQACRLPYGLIANGELKHLSFDGIEGIMGADTNVNEEVQYLLSPQDLCGLEQVEGLVKAGVSCLKIEGRLKDASYVAATTRA